jgi:hypothetical protein
MRAFILTLALSAIAATSADAEEWCGYTSRTNATIECGYSSISGCESVVGKGGMCFIDPDYALDLKRAGPAIAQKLARAGAG